MRDYSDDWRWIDDLSAPRPLGLLVALFVIVCVIAATGAWGQAPERPRGGVMFDCALFANAIQRIAVYRDVDANEDKTVAMFQLMNPQLSRPQQDVAAREIRRLWRERLPAEDAAWRLFMRCQQQLGDMGRES